MIDAFARLSQWLERILTAGLVVSALVLLAGLLAGSERALYAGLVLLILTPVARVLAVIAGFTHARDWPFAALSGAVLAVLCFGAWVGLGSAR